MGSLRPLVSVIVPTFNHGRFIAEAIESILTQTYTHLEIFVIDDGSTDETRGVLKKYEKEVNCVFQANRGVSSARNRGIRVSRGEWIAFLDSDDVWLPEKLEFQMEVALQDRSLGLIGCGVVITNPEGGFEREWIPGDYATHQDFLNELRVRNVFFNPSCALLLKDCFRRVGLFDDHLRFGEDWDLWLRVAKYYKVGFVRKPLVKFRRQFHSKSYQKERIIRADMSRILERHLPRGARKPKRLAYGYLYLDLSSLCRSEGRGLMALMYVLKSFGNWPLVLPQGDYRIPLLLNSMLGNRFYRKLRKLKEALLPAKRPFPPRENIL